MSGSRVTSLARYARLGWALARGTSLPFSVGFILTNRCNFRCEYCNIPARESAEMTTDELIGAIDQLTAAGMARAGFSGGEILLRPDAVPVVAHAKRRGLFTSMNTNGWLTDRELDGLVPVLDMLVLSLDGPEDVHDRVRRRKGSHRRVLEVLRALEGTHVAVATITVLGPWNLECIEEVLDVVGRYGAHAYFQPAYADCFDHDAGVDPVFRATTLGEIADRLQRAGASGGPLGSSPGYVERLRSGGPGCESCRAGRYYGTVLPDGTVVPCHLTSSHGSYLNGREVGFAEAFRSMPHPTSGPGCHVTPLQELDLLFRLDPGAIRTAARQVLARSGSRRASS